MEAFHEALRPWETFFLLVGTAGATLAGLMFVALTVARDGQLVRSRGLSITRSHSDPALLAFTLNLVLGAVTLAPTLTRGALGALLLLAGAASLVYITVVLRRLAEQGVPRGWDGADRVWYAGAPIVGGGLLLTAGGLAFAARDDAALTVVAGTLVLLLVMGVRNAWDLVTFAIDRSAAREDGGNGPG